MTIQSAHQKAKKYVLMVVICFDIRTSFQARPCSPLFVHVTLLSLPLCIRCPASWSVIACSSPYERHLRGIDLATYRHRPLYVHVVHAGQLKGGGHVRPQLSRSGCAGKNVEGRNECGQVGVDE